MVESPPSRSWVLPDEPVPIRLMATIWADADGLHDDLVDPGDLDAWLAAIGAARDGVRADDSDLADAVGLRDSARRLAGYVTGDDRTVAISAASSLSVEEAARRLNRLAARGPRPQLVDHGGRLELTADDKVSPVQAALAAVAESTMELLGGEDARTLRACHAPGCVLYFVKTHPRREWCSVACGNRARAARHYRKVRADRGRPTGAATAPDNDRQGT